MTGINMDAMRRKLAEQEKKTNGNKDLFWKPPEGESTIRIVPTADGDPFKDFWFHYNIPGNPGFLSPKKNFGEDCPLDRFVRQLFDEGGEENIKMAKSLMARQRFFAPVIVRGEEDKGVRVWGFGKTAYVELLNLVLNPDYGDITDPESGTDLVLKYGKPPGAQFPQTSLTPRRRTSPMLETADEVAGALESVPDFSKLFERKSAAEVQTILDEFLLSNDDVEEVSRESARFGKTGSDSEMVDKAFQDLMS